MGLSVHHDNDVRLSPRTVGAAEVQEVGAPGWKSLCFLGFPQTQSSRAPGDTAHLESI